jgi:hypothetical protein
VPSRAGFPDDPTFDPNAGGRLVTAVEHVGIEVDLAKPLDRLALRVDADLLEDLATLADRGEHSSGLEESAESTSFTAPSENDSRIQ